MLVGAEPELRPREGIDKKQASSSETQSSPMKLASVNLRLNDPIAVLKAGLRTVRHHQIARLAKGGPNSEWDTRWQQRRRLCENVC
jgi:hypothetical protein